MFTAKTLFWISLPGLLLAGLFAWWFFRADAVPLWLVIAVVGQVLLLGWWRSREMSVVLAGRRVAEPEAKAAVIRLWLRRMVVLFLLLVLAGAGQVIWLIAKYDFPPELAWREPLRAVGLFSVPVPEMVTVPAGEFQMGSDASNSEQPVHTVNIASSFEMAKHEVTFTEYDYFVGEMRQAGIVFQNGPESDQEVYPFPDDQGWGRGSRPVITVSWYNAQDYVNWLSKETGQQCRLPSEAEWEYAARAGTTTVYPWGDEASHEQANYGKDECCEGMASGRDQWENTAPVGQFPANPFGLHDMHGNVFEWVQDCWHENYQGAPADGSVWETECVESRRVLRGGAWNGTPNDLRSANRGGGSPVVRLNLIGFRLVCSPIER